ncbi:retropepsin-like aspartic protease family protein [Paenirhodobacter sp.]|uniref:retropepsin-like aspartic protease family protein n=1 Tax=Paenirhodobacter sp. TaxID=1965326 RepID=UPI003B3DF04A
MTSPPGLIYLALLLMALGGYFFAALRDSPGRVLQQISVWGLIFMGLIAGYGLWDDVRATLLPRQSVMEDGRIEIPLSPDGHYYLTARVNGTPVRFVVDTGATQIVLSRRDAERAGIAVSGLAFTGRAQTANGLVPTAPVRLATIDIGPIHDSDIRAVVNDGEMDGSLMGMTYLTRFARVEFNGNRMILER